MFKVRSDKSGFTPPRGMKDIEPEEMARRIWMYRKIYDVMRLYGFQMVEPTSIENLTTLEAKAGPDIKNEIYWFEDKAGRRLGLRFDLTVGMTRMVANRLELPEPIKFCSIAGMWRYDEPQFARYRNFHQWDAEIYGSQSQEADAEVISLGIDILESLGLKDYEVRISNRKLTEGHLKAKGLESKEKIEETIRVMDKIGKIPEGELRIELQRLKMDESLIDDIIDFARLRGRPDEILRQIPKINNQEGERGLEELSKLTEALNILQKVDKCVIDLSIVRGIGYYDGIVFEAFDKAGEDIGAIFAGGRYDSLCKIYGKRDMPATGVAGGIERLMISMERMGLFPKLRYNPEVFVASTDDTLRRECVGLMMKLRRMGIPAEFDLKGRTLKKQLEYANSKGIPYVLIVGLRELHRGKVRLRDMTKRTEVELKFEEAAEKILKTGSRNDL
ncbi:MAG: histidine--tRNA ligase [Candidatus Bathyarchaeia archaeon]